MQLPASWEKDFDIASDAKISQFAWQIGDFNPLHHDLEAAVDAGLLGPIAPGVMIGGFISSTIAEIIPGVMVRRLEIDFKNPLYAGSLAVVSCAVSRQRGRLANVAVTVKNGFEIVAEGSCLLLLPQT